MTHHRTARMGIGTLPVIQGEGCGTETIKGAIRWAFWTANLHRIEVSAMEFNQGACLLYQELAFVVQCRDGKCRWGNGCEYGVVRCALFGRK